MCATPRTRREVHEADKDGHFAASEQLVADTDHVQLSRLVTEPAWTVDNGRADTVYELYVDEGGLDVGTPLWGRLCGDAFVGTPGDTRMGSATRRRSTLAIHSPGLRQHALRCQRPRRGGRQHPDDSLHGGGAGKTRRRGRGMWVRITTDSCPLQMMEVGIETLGQPVHAR